MHEEEKPPEQSGAERGCSSLPTDAEMGVRQLLPAAAGREGREGSDKEGGKHRRFF